jgi:hypothetical protein
MGNSRYFYYSGKEITEVVKGKIVESVETPDDTKEQNDVLDIKFSDGSVLRLQYDWIYDWELIPAKIEGE